MSSNNMENDHDYVESRRLRTRSDNEGVNLVVRGWHGALRRHIEEASNSDHDYLPFAGAGMGNVNYSVMLSGSNAGDQDLFQDDDDDADEDDNASDVGGGSAVSSASSETLSSPGGSSITNSTTGTDSDATVVSEDTVNSESSISTTTTTNSTDYEVHGPSTSSQQLRFGINDAPSTSNATAARPDEDPNDLTPTATAPLPLSAPNGTDMRSASQPKKRKRLSFEDAKEGGTPKCKPKNGQDDSEEEDDGVTCPVCFDNWEMTGEHRLSALKCGHLFGESCIRRWLQESARQSGEKVCPQCKAKANAKDIRHIYAKRVRAIDRSEEHRLREELALERRKSQGLELELATFKMTHGQTTQKMRELEAENQSLLNIVRLGGTPANHSSLAAMRRVPPRGTYKLYLEKNIELSREPGCRVMKYAEQHSALIVSQKSAQGLFPGYGLRFVDIPTLKPSNFLHTSLKMVRDISLSEDQQMLAVTSMEQKSKLFDLRTMQAVAQFKPTDRPLWSCAMAQRKSEYYLYLGSQHGSTYVYDIRQPDTIVAEHQSDCSPVIHIEAVPVCKLFPRGGFLVCKLTSLWFFENISGGNVHATRLSVEGRLISMTYNARLKSLLVQTRSCDRFPRARHLLGNLNKVGGVPVFEMKVTFFASTNSPVMVRSNQIMVENNTLVAAYIQDTKFISLYDANKEQCVQLLPVREIVYDLCPLYTKKATFLAALTECKCRLYNVNLA